MPKAWLPLKKKKVLAVEKYEHAVSDREGLGEIFD